MMLRGNRRPGPSTLGSAILWFGAVRRVFRPTRPHRAVAFAFRLLASLFLAVSSLPLAALPAVYADPIPSVGGSSLPLTLSYTSPNTCATGLAGTFTFSQASPSFLGIPFTVDTSPSGAQALTISAGGACATALTAAAGVITVNWQATRLYLLAGGAGDLAFPNNLFSATIAYSDGTTGTAPIRELQTGDTGLVEFSS
ncbi:MAG: hypothetical protein NTZ05_03630 [Chloroflexi bacterium]|nr:hypothetical protein [Chloroflexota bacterium]